jgi:hypothetical protein
VDRRELGKSEERGQGGEPRLNESEARAESRPRGHRAAPERSPGVSEILSTELGVLPDPEMAESCLEKGLYPQTSSVSPAQPQRLQRAPPARGYFAL